MKTAEQKRCYEWRLDERVGEWSLNLFPNGKDSVSCPNILTKTRKLFAGKKEIILPFVTRKRNQNTSSHLIRLKQFEPVRLDDHYYSHRPNYDGKVDSTLLLIYEDWLDWEYRTEAYFLDGDFKTGRMPTKGGKYTENLREFKENLTEYFKPAQKWGLPPFGEYLGNFFKNSNLPTEVISSFGELAE